MKIELPKIGEARTRQKFFWWPTRFGRTIYWLESYCQGRVVAARWWQPHSAIL